MTAYLPIAERFTRTYLANPPGEYPHDLVVLVNGPKYKGIEKVFSPLPVDFRQHTNAGKDIGAFQMAASTIPCDLMVCLGAPVHFHKAGWLDRLVNCYLDNGPALYGCWGFHEPRDHIRTTAWWFPPELLNSYPIPIQNHNRYEFEHGHTSITFWTRRMGYPVLQVTWKGVFDAPNWHHVGVEDSLFLDQHFQDQ